MSADLEFHQSLPHIQLPPIEVGSRKSDEEEVAEIGGVARGENREYEDEKCRTPTSEEHRIPKLRSPPPVPRKKIGASAVFKRKRPDSETVDGKEIEEWFRSCFDQIIAVKIRKRQRN
ncbi:hypothetical protein Nepgr_001291 [Nepenthes gracilis]|uniref:Uncharacterized protein n=1 Tax=Nepenthes gracilis TaxID=150966 RepID=A0AAD3P8A8_NEPGR|nr:hypothetical protein Nepgr_001291 [Nepenthes gracilis]